MANEAAKAPLHQTPSRRIGLLSVARARDSKVSLLAYIETIQENCGMNDKEIAKAIGTI